MRMKKTIASLFLGITLVAVGLPLTPSLQLKTAFADTEAECIARGGTWTQADSLSDTGNVGQGSCTERGASITAGITKNSIAGPADCTPSWTNLSALFSPRCWMRMLGALISSLFVSLGVLILEIAGYLFNYLLNFSVVNFSELYSKVKDAVETGWTVFRDLANILIIGIFTFIAIGTILGLESFNAKKMVAKVLIIAVLINFSLLFTKMIIDASNFTALQFYKAALGQVAAAGAPVSSTGTTAGAAQSSGISGQFMQAIGITGFASAYGQVRAIQEKSDNGFIGVGFGILSFIFLVGAAIVLFYGCFLLVSRAILLIFLMVTSSLAFASYLIPAWETSGYGFKTWKDSLWKSAVFAPLLMLFLWITLLVAGGLKTVTTGTTGVTLGGAMMAPKDNVAAIVGYLMILGMLFLSFKLSSSFAGKISGFSMAALAPALGIVLGGRLASALGKPLLGGAAGAISRGLENASKARLQNMSLADQQAGKGSRLSNLLYGASKQFKKAEGRDFNMMNTKFGKDITGIAGLKGKWAGETKGGGIAADNKKAAEEYAKRAESANAATTEEQKKALVEAAKSINELPENKENKERLKKMTENSEKAIVVAKETKEANEAGHKAAIDEARKQSDTAKSQSETAMKRSEDAMKTKLAQIERDKEYTAEGSTARAEEEEKINVARKLHDDKMTAEKANIERAQEKVAILERKSQVDKDAVTNAQKSLEDVKNETAKFEAQMKKDVAEASAGVAKKYEGALDADELAAELANKRASNLFGALIPTKSDHLADLSRKQVRENKDSKNLKKLFEKYTEDSKKEPSPAAEKPADH